MCQRLGIAFIVVFSLGAVAQGTVQKLKVSDAPLASEQLAVYRVVLGNYLKGSGRVLNLANITEPFDEPDTACVTGLDSRVAKRSASTVHRIASSFVADTKITLVDSSRQQATIKENDPQNLIRKAVDDHQKIADEQLDQSVKSAFDTGLFTLSEIAFDREHRRAVVSYSFVCGGLCGNGSTLVLRKVGHNWKVLKRCGGWVS
jgi:hypothetical protein